MIPERWRKPDAICAVCGEPAVWPRAGKFGMGCRLHGDRPGPRAVEVPVTPVVVEKVEVKAPRLCPQRRNKRRKSVCRLCGRTAVVHGLCPRDEARRRVLGLPVSVDSTELIAAWMVRKERRFMGG